jgi:hypothetical protein
MYGSSGRALEYKFKSQNCLQIMEEVAEQKAYQPESNCYATNQQCILSSTQKPMNAKKTDG